LGIPDQGNDNHFMQRFALQTHAGFDPVVAMKFSLEHQNPLVTGAVVGGGLAKGDATVVRGDDLDCSLLVAEIGAHELGSAQRREHREGRDHREQTRLGLAIEPFERVADLIEGVRKNPGKLSFGSPGVGSLGHFSGEYFKATTKITYKHVPFQGSAPLTTALMGGHIDFLITALPAVVGKLTSGELKALASFEGGRLEKIKDDPESKEYRPGPRRNLPHYMQPVLDRTIVNKMRDEPFMSHFENNEDQSWWCVHESNIKTTAIVLETF
jgi:hypothetical protein